MIFPYTVYIAGWHFLSLASVMSAAVQSKHLLLSDSIVLTKTKDLEGNWTKMTLKNWIFRGMYWPNLYRCIYVSFARVLFRSWCIYTQPEETLTLCEIFLTLPKTVKSIEHVVNYFSYNIFCRREHFSDLIMTSSHFHYKYAEVCEI